MCERLPRLRPVRPDARFSSERISTAVPRSAQTRLLLSLVGVACLLAQLASAAHFALIGHRVCAEHGALVHSDHSHSAAEIAALEGRSQLAAALTALVESELHGHEHCGVFGERRERLAVRAREAWLPAFASAPLVTSLDWRAAPGNPVPLLFRAPKGSPPA